MSNIAERWCIGMSVLQGRNLSTSFKKSQTKPNIKHNRREGVFPENAIESRRDFNNHILHGDPRHEYNVVFGDALKEYNAKQKRKDRKIDDYYSHIYNTDGKQKPYEEFIIGLGNKDDWENATDEELREGVEVVSRMVYKFREKNPNMHFINADVHGDESHPHAHIIAVPVGEGYKRGLSKQVSFSKALENQGYDRQDFIGWRDDQMDVFESVLGSYGISRKHVGTNGYKDQEHYKQAKDEIKETARKEHGVLDLKTDMIERRENKVAEEERELQEKQREIDEQKLVISRQKAENEILENNLQIDNKEISKRLDRFSSVLEAIGVPETYRVGLRRFIETGSTGLKNKATGLQATADELMRGVNKKATVENLGNAMRQVEEDELDF